MQEEKDYLKKEIKKIISFLKRLIEKASNNHSLEELNLMYSEDFSSMFDYNLNDFINLTNKEFKEHLKNTNSQILENLLTLFYKLSKKEEKKNRKLCVEKALILLNLIDEKEKTFSLERMRLKQELNNIVPRETDL